MRIHFSCASGSLCRIFNYLDRKKLISSSNRSLLLSYKILQLSQQPILRTICSDSSLKTLNYGVREAEKPLDFQGNFLKENFNISDSYYLKLIVLPKECNNFDEILWTNELKYILTRSPFSYDVNFCKNPVISQYHPFATVNVNECADVVYHSDSNLVNKETFNLCNKVYLQKTEVKNSTDGKPTEEQLLLIIDRLTYCLINFFKQSQDFSMYHKNILFQNNIKGVTIRGLKAYVQSMYLLKLYGYFHFAQVKVEILKVTHHIEDGTIRVRWRVNGLPRHRLVIMLLRYKTMNWKALPEIETQWLDGFSVFSVDEDGLIYKHVCDKMIPDDDSLLAKKRDFKSRVLGLLGLAPRGPTAGTLNALIPCCKAPGVGPCKKLT